MHTQLCDTLVAISGPNLTGVQITNMKYMSDLQWKVDGAEYWPITDLRSRRTLFSWMQVSKKTKLVGSLHY